MQSIQFDSGDSHEIQVTQAEEDQIRSVLAGQAMSQRRLSDVATRLGVSEEQALKALQQVRMHEQTEWETQRVQQGMKREKKVLALAWGASLVVVVIMASLAYFGSKMTASDDMIAVPPRPLPARIGPAATPPVTTPAASAVPTAEVG